MFNHVVKRDAMKLFVRMTEELQGFSTTFTVPEGFPSASSEEEVCSVPIAGGLIDGLIRPSV
jgi:hypothetical protein